MRAILSPIGDETLKVGRMVYAEDPDFGQEGVTYVGKVDSAHGNRVFVLNPHLKLRGLGYAETHTRRPSVSGNSTLVNAVHLLVQIPPSVYTLQRTLNQGDMGALAYIASEMPVGELVHPDQLAQFRDYLMSEKRAFDTAAKCGTLDSTQQEEIRGESRLIHSITSEFLKMFPQLKPEEAGE